METVLGEAEIHHEESNDYFHPYMAMIAEK